MRKILALAAAGAALAFANPANAVVVLCSSGPGIDLTVDQCTASGNDHLADVEAAIALATGVNVNSLNLSLYGKSDKNPALFSFPPDGIADNATSTDWTVLNGQLIKYVTVKGATDFKIYELASPSSTGTGYSTLGILNGGNNTPGISHLSFWTVPGSAVPEPSTWAMLLIGFGGIGASLRRRKSVASGKHLQVA